jgi:hypothetical protein
MGIAWEGRRSPCCHQQGKTMRCFHDVSSCLSKALQCCSATCVSNRDMRYGPANTKIVACRRYAMYRLLRGVSTKNRANRWNSSCHPQVERPRQQAQKKICRDFVHALLEF